MAISYRSGMDLVDSMVITYRVYCLKHPETNEVFYVGKTTKELKERLSGHMGSIGSNGSNQDKNEYIRKLLAAGLRPLIEEIDVVYGTCYIHKIEISAKEMYWIKHYQSLNGNLTNHVGVKTDPLCNEWEQYVSKTKSGLQQPLYYYCCGKTKDGVLVYDEEKLSDDGFSMPITPRYTDYQRPEVIWTYTNIYDDENPDYIRGSAEEY